ncbi:hypothetical protein H4R18_005260 [Coemansia javaensis]|uniref:BZIP domain-containing protein n=1 Tax=Coemansia javaensis TaxID=2761396 RepID=A0A9W8H3Q8_9FUNG|nr:hypothetical protein H4R18_005260 [Coemansia javaensis]
MTVGVPGRAGAGAGAGVSVCAEDGSSGNDSGCSDDYSDMSESDSALHKAGSGSASTNQWRDSVQHLETPRTADEVAQEARRTRNREAARRSREKKKTVMRDLRNEVKRLEGIFASTEKQLAEFREINEWMGDERPLIDPRDVADAESSAQAARINRVYAQVMRTMRTIVELQLHLDHIAKVLKSMVEPK